MSKVGLGNTREILAMVSSCVKRLMPCLRLAGPMIGCWNQRDGLDSFGPAGGLRRQGIVVLR